MSTNLYSMRKGECVLPILSSDVEDAQMGAINEGSRVRLPASFDGVLTKKIKIVGRGRND